MTGAPDRRKYGGGPPKPRRAALLSVRLDAPSSALVDDLPRIEVAVVPDTSPFVRDVRAAAAMCGAEFVRADAAMPNDLASRLYVVDLTRALATALLGLATALVAVSVAVTTGIVLPCRSCAETSLN